MIGALRVKPVTVVSLNTLFVINTWTHYRSNKIGIFYNLIKCMYETPDQTTLSRKNIGITQVNHSATPKAILTKVHDCTCNLNVYIFYLRFALGIIHGDRCDSKTPKTIILFK